MTLRPSWSSRLAKLWRSVYGVALVTLAASSARRNERRRHDWYAASVHGAGVPVVVARN
jgi:hypothetical protein